MKHIGGIAGVAGAFGLLLSLLFCGDPPSDSTTKKSDATIFIASIPPVADVYMDEVLIGKTNVKQLDVCSGRHNMSFKKDILEFDTTMTFTSGKNETVMVNFGE